MLQARQLGKELYVGVHSDEDILHNKGPVVMKLPERLKAVEACKWSTKAISSSPYVTDPKVMEEYECKYVVHGDDITTDANGEDCYQIVKDLGKFVVVKRTPNISTTDLVGRMLLMSKNHHFKSITKQNIDNHSLLTEANRIKFKQYAADETGLKEGGGVYINISDQDSELINIVEPSIIKKVQYKSIYYIDGGFDLFHPGQIEALRIVKEKAEADGSSLIVGIHDDFTVNSNKGLNYPIMNTFERSLCVLQCRYVDGIILSAPYIPTLQFLSKLPGTVKAVYHGPTPIDDKIYDVVKQKGLFREIGHHEYDEINTEFIVDRVLKNKEAYEERQRRKGWKAETELKLKESETNR